MNAPQGPTSHRFVSQRLNLHYLDWGNPEAPLLILQHGGRDHARCWDWIARDLSKDWHVVCPDLRGHGDSDWSPEGHYAMNAFVFDFAQLVETLGQAKVTIIAHSLGGAIATRFTGMYPEKVARLVNIEGLGRSTFDTAPAEVSASLRRWFTAKREVATRTPRRYPTQRAALERMRAQNGFLSEEQASHLTMHAVRRNEDGTWSWKFDNAFHAAFWDPDLATPQVHCLWEAIDCPVLLLWGMKSFASSPREDGRMAHFRNARLIEYPEAGHWLQHERFDEVLRDVKDFFSEPLSR